MATPIRDGVEQQGEQAGRQIEFNATRLDVMVDGEVVGFIALHEDDGDKTEHWVVEVTTYDRRVMRWAAKDRPAAEQTAFQMLSAQMGLVDLLTKFKNHHQVQVTFH